MMKFLTVTVQNVHKVEIEHPGVIHLMCLTHAYPHTHTYSDVVNQKLMFINNKFDMREIFVIPNVWG